MIFKDNEKSGTEVTPTEEKKNKPVSEKCIKKEITLKAIKQNLELASELICFCKNCLDNIVNEGDDTCETSCED